MILILRISKLENNLQCVFLKLLKLDITAINTNGYIITLKISTGDISFDLSYICDYLVLSHTIFVYLYLLFWESRSIVYSQAVHNHRSIFNHLIIILKQ